MDRRSWPWQRKSTEKSPGQTESSGSILSSHSERITDDRASSNQNVQLPEVTSKVAPTPGDEEVNGSMKILKEKLSTALSDISAKDELVKQHAKVAEEAVTGWEKAEKEVSILKHQLETSSKENAALECRVSYLDGALKECVRQLCRSREELDHKVQEAVARSSQEWKYKKSKLESQLNEVHAHIETAENEAATHLVCDLQTKLDAAEKENVSLVSKLALFREQLELRTVERDLSTEAAEAASKQHLASIKKVVKLEAELRRLKNAALKAYPTNDSVSFTASSAYVESLADSQSDCGERLLTLEGDLHKARSLEQNEREASQSDSLRWPVITPVITDIRQSISKRVPGQNAMVPPSEISLMDDFLEMERLAALTDTVRRTCTFESYDGSEKSQNILKADLGAMVQRTADLEKKLETAEAERMELQLAITLCRGQLEGSKEQLKDKETKLDGLQRQLSESLNQLKASQARLNNAEAKLVELQYQLTSANDLRLSAERELQAMNAKRHEAESRLKAMEAEISCLRAEVNSLEDESEKQKALHKGAIAKCCEVEDELLRMKNEADLKLKENLKRKEYSTTESKAQQEKELAVAAGRLAECQKTLARLGRQLKSLATLDELLVDLEQPVEVS